MPLLIRSVSLSLLVCLFLRAGASYGFSQSPDSPPSDRPLRTLSALNSPVTTLQFSPNGKILAVGYANGLVKLWDSANGSALATLTGHRDAVRGLAFSPDNRLLITGGLDSTLRFWESPNWENIRALQVNAPINAIAFAPDGRTVVTASDRAVQFWEPATRRLVRQITPAEARGLFPARALAFSPDGKLLTAGGGGRAVFVWNSETGSQQQELKCASEVVSLSFSPDGKRLAAGCARSTAQVWNRASWERLRAVPGESGHVALTRTALAILADSEVVLRNPNTGVETATVYTEGSGPIAASPEGGTLALGRPDGGVSLWDMGQPGRDYPPNRWKSPVAKRTDTNGNSSLVGEGKPSIGKPDSLDFVNVAGVRARVIRVNLADPRVRVTVQVAQGFPRGDESFGALLKHSRPTIAINGNYFSKMTKEPTGSIVADGKLLYEGWMGTALAITPDKQVVIRRVNRGHHEDWSGYETVIGCGPALVLNGKTDVRAEEEGFHDPSIMGATARMALGITADRHLLLVNTLSAITFRKEAEIMRALGCVDALNLDAGSSQAMMYRGRVLISPGRPLVNLLLVYVDK